jgi:DNA-binding transcriptional LysR family regulator
VTLTEAGRTYLDYCQRARDALSEAERAVSAVRSEVAGRLRVTAPASFGETFLPDLALAFRAEYPAVELDLDLSNAHRDLLGEGYDFAFRSVLRVEAQFVARPLGVVRDIPLARPDLVERHGPVRTPADLARLPVIVNSHFSDDSHWVFTRKGQTEAAPVRGPLRVNQYSAIKRAVLMGAGAARLPRYMVDAELLAGALVKLLPEYELITTPLWLVYPSRRHQPLRNRAFVDFVMR